MTNIIEVQYGKNALFPVILINGEQISRYMTLTNYIYDDALNWVDLFFQCMDDELDEDYIVRLTGHPFHEMLFQKASKRSSFCKDIEFTKLEFTLPIKEKYDYIVNLNKSYPLLNSQYRSCIDFNVDEALLPSLTDFDDVTFNQSQSPFAICRKGDEIDKSKNLVIILSDDFYWMMRGATLTLEIQEDQLSVLLDYLNIYRLRLEAISTYISNASKAKLPAETKMELEAMVDEKICAIIDEAPSRIGTSEKETVSFRTFPASAKENDLIRLVSDDENVIIVDRYELIGAHPGTTTIRLLDENNQEITSFSVKCIKTHYAQNIAIILPSITMSVGETMMIKTMLSPEDADDADELTFHVSDEKVAMMNGKNTLYGIAAGRICVTASTKRVQRKFYISVVPKPLGLVTSKDSLSLPLNAKVKFGCSYYPADASPVPEVKWECKDASIIEFETQGGFETVFKTLARGRTTLVCKTLDGSLSKEIPLEVK